LFYIFSQQSIFSQPHDSAQKVNNLFFFSKGKINQSLEILKKMIKKIEFLLYKIQKYNIYHKLILNRNFRLKKYQKCDVICTF